MSTGVLLNPSLHELESTYGVFFIGYVVSMVLYGFTFFQTYVYFSRYPKDHRFVKLTVAALCLIDTATSALISQALYFYLITMFPFAIGLIDATSTFCAEIGLATLAVYIVQMFYASRVWSLSKSRFLLGAVVLTSSAGCALGITMTAQMIQHRAFSHLAIPHVRAVAASSQGLTFISGFLSTGISFYYLQPSRKPSMKPLDGWFDQVVAYTFSRGSAATVIQLAYFVVFATMPGKPIWMPFHLTVSKLYINSLLTLLNSRDVYHGQGVNEEQTISSLQAKSGSMLTSSGRRSGTGIRFNVVDTSSKPGITIEVSHTVERDGDKAVYDLNQPSFDVPEDDSMKASLEP